MMMATLETPRGASDASDAALDAAPEAKWSQAMVALRENLRVRDVMTRAVLSVRACDSIAGARALMRDTGVHQLVVRDPRRRVLGVISAADVRQAPPHACVGDFVYRRLVSVEPDAAIGAAAALMRSHHVASLPVLDGHRLVGIITRSDMLEVIDKAYRGSSSRADH
jgi:CBS domain-containing protein